MSPAPHTLLGPRGVVVGIGDQGLETSRAAVQLGAQEAAMRQVSLRLVHGSKPGVRQASPNPSDMEIRQQRGRRLVNGAARELAATPIGRSIQIWTESSPQTGAGLLVAHSRTAAMLVLQRCAEGLPLGPTAKAVSTGARCATFITRPGHGTTGDLGVLVLSHPEEDPAPAVALAFAEATLRGTQVTVLDGGTDPSALELPVSLARARHPDISVDSLAVGAVTTSGQFRDLTARGVLMVVVRPRHLIDFDRVATAVDAAACPVAIVAPTGFGA